MEFSTRTIHAGQPSEPETGSLIAPIFQTSTYEQESPGCHRGFDYSRTNNPTRARLEAVLADLEGVRFAAVFASGLAAENAVLQAWLKPGDEIVISQDVYGGTYRILTRVFQPLGCVIRQIDVADAAALDRELARRPKLVWIESPTNPRLLVYDIAALCAAAHAAGALVVIDNTFATPLFQQPFALGADIVVHSVTKYLAGHSDLIQGAVLARDAAVFEPIKFLQNATGAVPSPFDCWLTLRGLKTLELRMQRHAENAEAIAHTLVAHPLVRRVYFPGLPDHPGHDIARRQMTGFGGMVSFELDGTVDEVVSLVSSRRFFALGESLGGVKSLVCHPARMTHASIPADARAQLGLSDTLIRLSPGCEHRKDLVADLVEGLATIAGSRAACAKATAGAWALEVGVSETWIGTRRASALPGGDMRNTKGNPLLGAIVGAIGGLAGSWAMIRFNHAIGGGGSHPGDSHPHRRRDAQPNDTDGTFPDEPASMQFASAVARPVVGRPLDEQEKEIGGSIMHYLFGAFVGAMYGAAAETQPSATAGAGIPFGTAVWVAADEIGVPLAGFASNPKDYPISRHAAALGSHVVFGLTVETVRRLLRGNRGNRGYGGSGNGDSGVSAPVPSVTSFPFPSPPFA